jgi:hypothetical protein
MPSTPFTLFELSTSLASHRDRKFMMPINIRFERQDGRRRFSLGCLFLTHGGHAL